MKRQKKYVTSKANVSWLSKLQQKKGFERKNQKKF